MRIAVPMMKGRLSSHFGVSREVALFDVDPDGKRIVTREDRSLPPHAPGRLPEWLKTHGANLVIAGGMGERAQALLAAAGIQVVLGAPYELAEILVTAWLEGRLETDPQPCNHDHHDHGHDDCHSH